MSRGYLGAETDDHHRNPNSNDRDHLVTYPDCFSPITVLMQSIVIWTQSHKHTSTQSQSHKQTSTQAHKHTITHAHTHTSKHAHKHTFADQVAKVMPDIAVSRLKVEHQRHSILTEYLFVLFPATPIDHVHNKHQTSGEKPAKISFLSFRKCL